MKKIYMMPSMKVKTIKPTTILAGSLSSTLSSATTTTMDAKQSFGFDETEVDNSYGKVNNSIW